MAGDGENNDRTDGFLIAGGMGGKLRHGPTGRYVQLNGYDWSQVLITLAHAIGVPQINKLGDLGMKDGPVPGLMA